jgi:hypothetical protein
MGSKHHQDGVPVEKFKFDADADKAARSDYSPVFNTDGQPVVMPKVHKARMKAQMDSHKKPGNRVK